MNAELEISISVRAAVRMVQIYEWHRDQLPHLKCDDIQVRPYTFIISLALILIGKSFGDSIDTTSPEYTRLMLEKNAISSN